jgi:adenylate cyclase class 1
MSEKTSAEILQTVEVYKKNFQEFNSKKLQQLYTGIGKQEVINLFEYIPFLLHTNLPDFPGYINYEDMPVGIYGYTPSTKLMGYIRKQHPSVLAPKTTPGTEFIQMFALMGSGGTIAFTSQSDFDYWVCAYEEKFDPNAVRQFKIKCKLIEEWIAETYNIEVHFFLNDISKVKKNVFDDDEEMGISGTSLGQLLKEEFFRSSIVISGKIPTWWVVPVNTGDEEYGRWLAAIEDSRYKADFIDIGNLARINRADFLIAALFQILKSIGNPFKSIIKLGLLEKYLSTSEENPFISTMIKANVHGGKVESEQIDAYLIMFDEVYKHYNSAINDPTTINIIKTCFYLKVDPRLSEGTDDETNKEKNRLMTNLTKVWGWDSSTIRRVDNFESWDIEATSRLLTNTKKFILKGYKQILNSIESGKAQVKILDESIKLISHKIYSHFLPAENKIDNTLSFKSHPPVKLLTIEFIRDKDNREYWILSKKQIEHGSTAKVMLQKNPRLFGLVVWIALNGFFQKGFTRLEIDPGLHVFDPNFIRDLITELSLHFSFKKLSLKNSYFLRESFPVISYLIINPFTKYGNDIVDMIFLYHNSWGETRFELMKNGEMDIPHILTRVINSGHASGLDFDSALKMTASLPYNSKKEFKKIKLLAKDIYNFFNGKEYGESRKRYISMFGNNYYLFSSRKGKTERVVNNILCETELKLLYSMSYNRGIETDIRVDPSIPELKYLGAILENFKKDSIQIYYLFDKKYCHFFISDERGSLMFLRKNKNTFVEYIASLYLYTENLIKNIIENNPKSPFVESKSRLEIYKMEKDIKHNCAIKLINITMDPKISAAIKTKGKLKLSLHLLESGEFGYRFTLPDGGLSEIFDRNDVDEIAKEFQILMDSVEGYNYYVTDVNLDHIGVNMYRQHTSLAFSEKNRFELMIEKGMKLINLR